MVKKMKSSSDSSHDTGGGSGQRSHLAASVKASAQQIWLAGMGAFAKAQEEGTKVFEGLVKEGASLQKKTQGIAEDKIGEVTGKMSAMADTVSAKAGQNWDKLEAIFEQRTAKAMGKLGVPTAKDVAALAERVDELAAAVARFGRSASARSAAAKPAARSSASAASKAAVKPSMKRARKSA